MRRRVAIALALTAAGLALGAALGLTRAGYYEASTALEVLPPVESPLGEEAAADLQAATYAQLVETRSFLEQIRPQVAAGRLTVDELEERVHARHQPGTALLEILGRGPTVEDARGLSVELSATLLTAVQQGARARATQVADALRRQLEQLDEQIGDATDPERAESLREQRRQVARRLADVTAAGVEAGNRLRLAAVPEREPEHVTPRPWLWLAGGGLAGLLVGALLGGLRLPRLRLPQVRLPERPARPERPLPRPEPRPAPAPTPAPTPAATPTPEPTPTPAPTPAPATATLLAPVAGELVRGVFPLLTDPPGKPVHWSQDGASWRRLKGGELDTFGLGDGRYVLRVEGSSEQVPIVVDNDPPRVTLEPPIYRNGVVVLKADAADDGTGVDSVTFMASPGTADWTPIPDAWVPPEAGVYWFCAVAADRAGNRATSELMPLRVGPPL